MSFESVLSISRLIGSFISKMELRAGIYEGRVNEAMIVMIYVYYGEARSIPRIDIDGAFVSRNSDE